MRPLDEHVEIAKVIKSLVATWNRREAISFKNLFREDANYITGDGGWLKGHRAIADLCSEAGEIVSLVEEPSISVYGDTATATFRWSVENERVGGIITLVVNKTSSHWKIVTLQNTDLT